MNRLSTMISVLSDNKALEHGKLVITTSAVGSSITASEGSINFAVVYRFLTSLIIVC